MMFYKYVKQNKLLLIAYLIVVPVSALCSAQFSMSLEPLLNVITRTDKAENFAKVALTCVLFSFLDMIAYYLHRIYKEKLRVYFVAGMKRDVFHSLFNKSINEFNAISTAQYTSIINRDISKLDTCYFDSICGIYSVAINFIVNLFVVLYVSPVIAIINISISLVSVCIPKFFEKKMQQKQEYSSEKSEEYYAGLRDYLNGFSTIKLFHIQNKIKEKMELKNKNLENANFESVAINFTSSWVSMLCSQLSFVVTIIVGVYLVLNGWLSVGAVVAVSQLIGGIAVPFEQLPMYLSNYKSISGIKDKIQKLIDTEEVKEEKQKEFCVECQSFEVNNIVFAYNENTPLIKNVSLSMKENGKYIFVGGSGSGKSTMAKLLMGFYPCNSGTVSYGNREISEYSEKQFYRLVTYLEQDTFLFDDSLLHNITLYQEYSKEEVDRAIKLSGLGNLIEKLPNGINTQIKENGHNFSGGEKQRIGIARALISGAKFLVLDEVTASLDPALASDIENMVMSLPDTGVLLITHKWSEGLFKKADSIFVMKNGELVEQGAFADLMEQKKYFYSYYYNL